MGEYWNPLIQERSDTLSEEQEAALAENRTRIESLNAEFMSAMGYDPAGNGSGLVPQAVELWGKIEAELLKGRQQLEIRIEGNNFDTTLKEALMGVVSAAETPWSDDPAHKILNWEVTAFYNQVYEGQVSHVYVNPGEMDIGTPIALSQTYDPTAERAFSDETGRRRTYNWYYDQIMNGSYSSAEAMGTIAAGSVTGVGVASSEYGERALKREAFQVLEGHTTTMGEHIAAHRRSSQGGSYIVEFAERTGARAPDAPEIRKQAESRAAFLLDPDKQQNWGKAIWDEDLLTDFWRESVPGNPQRSADSATARSEAALDTITQGTWGACNISMQMLPGWIGPIREAINHFDEVVVAQLQQYPNIVALTGLQNIIGSATSGDSLYMALILPGGLIKQLQNCLLEICRLWTKYLADLEELNDKLTDIARMHASWWKMDPPSGGLLAGEAAEALQSGRDAVRDARRDPVRVYESNQERLVFKEQCFLLAYIKQIAEPKKTQLDTSQTTGKRLPYLGEGVLDRNATLLLDGDPYGFINRLTVGENIHTLHNLETNIISNLQPRIQLYKIEYNEDEDLREREIIFSTHAGDNPLLGTGQNSTERALTQQNRGSGVGIQSFNFSYEGSNPFAVKKSIKANLKIFANSFDELFEDQGGYMYADLALKTGGATQDQTVTNNGTGAVSNPCASERDQDDRTQKENENLAKLNFRLKAVVGWARPPGNLGNVMSDAERAQIQDAVADSYVTLQLTPTVHSFDIDEFGRVVFDINYLAYVEDFFDQNTVFNVFASSDPNAQSATYKSIERQLKLSYYRKNCETSEIQTIKGEYNKEIGAEKEIALQNLMKALMEQKKIYYLDIPYSEIQGFVTGGPFYQYEAGAGELNVLNDSGNSAALQSNIQEAIKAAGFTEEEGADEEDDNMRAFRSALFAGGDFENVSMQFFYISDLIDILLSNIETELGTLPGLVESNLVTDVDQCQKFLKVQQLRKSQKALRQLRILLGPVEFYSHNEITGEGTSSSGYYNLGDVPISVKYFIEWLTQKMLQKEETTYSLSRFLNDLFNGLIRNFLNNDSCFNVKASQKIRVSQTTLTSYPPRYDEYAYDEITRAIAVKDLQRKRRDPHGTSPRIRRASLSWWSKPDRIKPVINLNPKGPAASAPVNEEINYFVFFAGRVQPLERMLGRRVDDEKVGIFHYVLGRDKGLIKNIKLQKTQTPGLQEVRFEQEGFDGLEQLRVVYDVEIESYSNVQIYPGTYIYVEPQGFGSSNRISRLTDIHGKALDLTKFGLGGYYMVYRSEHSFGPGRADSTLQAKWVNQLHREPTPTEEGDQGEDIQTGTTRPSTCRAAAARSDTPGGN